MERDCSGNAWVLLSDGCWDEWAVAALLFAQWVQESAAERVAQGLVIVPILYNFGGSYTVITCNAGKSCL